MADKEKFDDVPEDNPDMDRALERGGIPKNKPAATKTPLVYKVMGDSRVPVPKSYGKLWKSRRDQAKRKMTTPKQAWDEAIQYYNAGYDHRDHSDGQTSGNRRVRRKLNEKFSEIENIIFANINALVPMLYSKEPSAEMTAVKEENKEFARMAELLVNTLTTRKVDPCLRLKSKAKRAIVVASLTNNAFFETGYVRREESSEEALENLLSISNKLEKAKDAKTIEQLEGQLEAMLEAVDILRPSGPYVTLRMPWDVLVDPASTEPDLSDAGWIMVADMLPLSYIKARYGQDKDKDNKNETASIYKPTHIIRAGGSNEEGLEGEVNSFSLINSEEADDASMREFGYEDKLSYDRAKYIKVWSVWDKTTRRMFLYNDNDWSWPIWVWDDPYNLDTFFPLTPLAFYTNPLGGQTKGEVSYILDQQDAINEINSEKAQARQWAKRNIFYNKNAISKADFERAMSGDDNNGFGIDLPIDVDLNKVINSLVPPSMHFMELFDKTAQLEAINRISSVSDVMRGVQFKTNTTNQAIDKYSSVDQTMTDDRIDTIEDALGNVLWQVLQMCMQFMSATEVQEIIGADKGQTWRTYTHNEIHSKFSLRVVGGSTIKPTSAAKKKQALEISQVLGQYVDASPVAVIVSLQLMQDSFDEINIEREQWDMLIKSVESAIQGQAGSSGNGGEGGQVDPVQIAQQTAELLDQLPPEIREGIGKSLAAGVPASKVFEFVVQQLQQQEAPAQEQPS